MNQAFCDPLPATAAPRRRARACAWPGALLFGAGAGTLAAVLAPSGDEAIRRLAACVDAAMRRSDVFARIGERSSR